MKRLNNINAAMDIAIEGCGAMKERVDERGPLTLLSVVIGFFLRVQDFYEETAVIFVIEELVEGGSAKAWFLLWSVAIVCIGGHNRFNFHFWLVHF